MNTQSDSVESPLQSTEGTPAHISPAQRMYWSVRRELWESRSIYIAPLAAAALFLLGFLISMIHMPEKVHAAMALDPMQQQEFIQRPFNFAALLIMGATFLVSIFYCLDALHGERRDRSILFWKSLPVSDLTTVLAKASIPLFLLPVVTFAITVAMQCIMLLIGAAAVVGSGVNAATLWSQLGLFQMWLMLFFHLLAIHGLWYAPFYGWLLLVSGWARRAALLWASLPLFAIGIVEKIAFNTSHFSALLGYRFGGPDSGPSPSPGSMSMGYLTPLTVEKFLISPGLWIGLAVTAAFLAAAVRLRRCQAPI
jgi:ABC-2 type transport system permease protein